MRRAVSNLKVIFEKLKVLVKIKMKDPKIKNEMRIYALKAHLFRILIESVKMAEKKLFAFFCLGY